jgi:Tfp pilus assembly protein PilP
MKLTTGILALTMTAGAAWAQVNPASIMQNTRSKMQAVQQQKTADSNAALGSSASPAGATTTAGQGVSSAPAPAVAKGKSSKPAGKAAKPQAAKSTAKPVAVIVPKTAKATKSAKKEPKPVVAADGSEEKSPEKEKKYSVVGKRDPFLSPVVSHTGGAGCNTGKKCLEVGQINLRGIVKSDNGMIAVVTNAMNKAYFLRENDPVFNGFVLKITGDSITFKEMFQDKLGKPFTRDVTKTITTPAV